MKEGRKHQSIHFLDSKTVGLRKQRLFSKQVLGRRADTTLKIQGEFLLHHCLTRDVSTASSQELRAHVLILSLPTANRWNRAQNRTASVREVNFLKGQQHLSKAASPTLCQSQCVCRGERMCPSAGECWAANHVALAKPVQGHELCEYFLATLIWSRVIDGSCSFTYCWACLGHWSQDL